MAKLEPTMFREYDLRGRVSDTELNEESIRIIARAYGTMLNKRGITDAVVGHDLRTGSKELTEVAVDGLRSTGVNVIFLGQILTPIMYAAQYHYQTKGGMMVTASHNPGDQNGFKMVVRGAEPTTSEDLRNIGQWIKRRVSRSQPTAIDLGEGYANRVLEVSGILEQTVRSEIQSLRSYPQ